MKNTTRLPVATFVLAALFSSASGADDAPARTDILIEPKALAASIAKSEPLDILDARGVADYSRGHVPGAVAVDVNAWKSIVHAKGGYTNAKAWAKAVAAVGVDGSRPVVVYGSSSNPTGPARVWWTLKYLGVERVRFLDGGLEAWERGKHPTSTDAVAPRKANFEPRFQKDRLATIEELKESTTSKKLVVVDSRSAAECARGKIPDAVHLEWKEMLDDDGRFKSAERIRALLAAKGVKPGKPLVPY